jgi:hypothetical protein
MHIIICTPDILEFKSLRHLVISAPIQIGTKLNGPWSNRHLTIVNSAPMYIFSVFICTLENYNFIDILVINI